MNKQLFSILLLALSVLPCEAQENKPLIGPVKFSGYMIGRYTANFQDGNESNQFSFRLIRVTAKGTVYHDQFAWTLQGQVSGNTENLGNSPRVVDANLEWQKYKEFKIKAGQFKRPFTFGNPLNPIDIGFMANSQLVQKLAGMSDRTNERGSNGRDQGIQIQGDVFPNKSGRALLHYQVGIFNGQGINTGDKDQQKDIIGGFWVMPILGVRVGAFGWTGSYARNGVDASGVQPDGLVKVYKNRYALSAEYQANDWIARAEYAHSQGFGFKDPANTKGESNTQINYVAGDKADAWYALLSVPVIKNLVHIRGRYDVYRSQATWASAKTIYELEGNYMFTQKITLALDYAIVNDRTLSGDHNYSMLETRMSVKF